MQPLLCRANDDRHYVVKPLSSSMHVASSFGVGLRATRPRGRDCRSQITAKSWFRRNSPPEWNAINERKVEPGPGFWFTACFPAPWSSRASQTAAVPEALRLRVLAFDWWIRNHGSRRRRIPTCSGAQRRAGFTSSITIRRHRCRSAVLFWGTLLFKSMAPSHLTWLAGRARRRVENARARLLPSPLLAELPSAWTTSLDGLTWFARQLNAAYRRCTTRLEEP